MSLFIQAHFTAASIASVLVLQSTFGYTSETVPLPPERPSSAFNCTHAIDANASDREKMSHLLASTVAVNLDKGGYGSGFVIDIDNQYILTAAHVVEDANISESYLLSYDKDRPNNKGEEINFRLIGSDEKSDVAVLQAINSNLSSCVELSDFKDSYAGEPVFAVGHPMGQLFTISTGIISNFNRNFGISNIPYRLIQTDAAINPGNSGGPLYNNEGQVIGLNSFIYRQNGLQALPIESLGYAISAPVVQDIATQLIEEGSVKRNVTGLSLSNIPRPKLRELGLEYGLRVTYIPDWSLAANSSIEKGDIITRINGNEFYNHENYSTEIYDQDTVYLTVVRDDQTYVFSVPVEDENKFEARKKVATEFRRDFNILKRNVRGFLKKVTELYQGHINNESSALTLSNF
jgi:serine protease Do